MKNFFAKNYWWAIPAALAIVAALYVWSQNRRRATPASNPKGEGLDKNVVLYNGISGHSLEVSYLQRWLNERGATLKADGRFGPKTADALHKQKGVWEIALKNL